jgi:hypothetical protein
LCVLSPLSELVLSLVEGGEGVVGEVIPDESLSLLPIINNKKE